MSLMDSKPVERHVYFTYQVRALTRRGNDQVGHTINFPDEKSAVEFVQSGTRFRDCRIVKCEIQETVIELQRYEARHE